MAPEVRWQASSVAARSGNDALASDQDTVESLLRRLIRRIEESERRYAEALDELQARLGHVSYNAAVTEVISTPEETETLERLRFQLSALTRRLEQPPQPPAEIDRQLPLDKALAEVCAVSAGLAVAEPDWFASSRPLPSVSPGEPELAPASPHQESSPSTTSPSVQALPISEEQADLDRRLIEMAQQLERSIGEAMPAAAIDNLNARMQEISARFEAALEQTPKLELLRHIERQVTDMGQQLGRVELQAARIDAVEGQLQRLIDRFDEAPRQVQGAASKAAEETARLVSEAGGGKPSVAERLDALHRDIVAMNERNVATDDRLVDTLVALHESLKALMRPGERERARGMTTPPTSPRTGALSAEPHVADFAQLRSRVDGPPVSSPPLFPHAKNNAAAGDIGEERSGRGTVFIRDIPFESTDDLVASARRAARAAAAKAEQRDASRLRRALSADETKRSTDEPGRHKVSLLMVAAALLLMISAALLFTRLKLKPDFYPPPAAEQSVPAPAAEAPPLPELPAQPETAPADPAPPAATAPDAAPKPEPDAPSPAPAVPHAVTPSANPVGIQPAPAVCLGDARGDANARPELVSAGSGGGSVPPGFSVTVIGAN